MPEIEGYKVVTLKMAEDAKNCHSIYMKEHFIRLMDPNKPKGRTLFLLNIPPYVTEESLKKFFQTIGSIAHVSFAEKAGKDETQKWHENCTPFSNVKVPFKFKVGYVVFDKSSSLERALVIDSIDLYNKTSGESYVESGMFLWLRQFKEKVLNEAETQVAIDKYIKEYDERKKQEEEEAARNAIADADGWITVGKSGKNAGFEQKESVIGRLEDKIAKGKKKKELTNFYTFQIREAKMKNIIDLRKKFEEDKRKIEMIKQTRRFRPF